MTLTRLNERERLPKGNTALKIKRHLQDIYKIYLARKDVVIKFKSLSMDDFEKLEPIEYAPLKAKPWNNKNGKRKLGK